MKRTRAISIVVLLVVADIAGLVWAERSGISLLSSEIEAGSPLGVAEEGRMLFADFGCNSCHGVEARGGVMNAAGVTERVPALDTFASRLLISDREEIDTVLALLEERVDLATVEEPPFPRFEAFRAEFQTVCRMIGGGCAAAELDAGEPSLPLAMPGSNRELEEWQVHSMMAYLITLEDRQMLVADSRLDRSAQPPFEIGPMAR